jgi:hypothetical protein
MIHITMNPPLHPQVEAENEKTNPQITNNMKTTSPTLAALASFSAKAESGKHTKTKKNFTNRQALVPLAFGIVALSAASAHAATVIYSDSFGRSGDVNASAPDIRPGAETWTASTTWKTNGTQAEHDVLNGANGFHALLPFTPAAGNVYRLEASISANNVGSSAANRWVGIGFNPTTTTAVDIANNYPSAASPFLFESSVGWKAFMPLGGETSPVATGAATAGLAEMYAIELDTTALLWTVSFFVHGNPIPVTTQAYATNPSIGAVGIMT